jgi:uncharacterized cupredoxin-like copper-binding protein
MKRLLLAAPVALLMFAPPGLAAEGPPGHSHGHSDGHQAFSAGEPGDPKKPARIVPVVMREADGKMIFVPEKMEVRRGEQVRFLLTNTGELDHEFVLASTEDNLKHAELMKKDPEMGHDDPNSKRLKPRAKSEIVWRFTRVGTFEFACLIPGHREAGMIGTVVVK